MNHTSPHFPESQLCSCCGPDGEVGTAEEFLELFETWKSAPADRLIATDWFLWTPTRDLSLEPPAVRQVVEAAFEAGLVLLPEDESDKRIGLAARVISIAEH